jgi:hypothetical protein
VRRDRGAPEVPIWAMTGTGSRTTVGKVLYFPEV